MRARTRIWMALFLGAAMVVTLAPMAGYAAFKGDNGRIFYFRETNIESFEIFSMRSNGSDRTRLTNDEIDDLDPFASPNGRWVVWERDLNDGQLDVFKMKANGSGRVNLTTDSGDDVDDQDPSWSPNGRKIVYGSERDEQDQLWIMKADGSGDRMLTDDVGSEEEDPVWSQNGKWIAFVRDYDADQVNQICRIRPDGTDESCLTDDDFTNVDDPDWSPNSTKIAFEGRQPDDGGVNENVYVMKANGTDVVQLTDVLDDASDPAYSPSGAKIVYETSPDAPNGMFIMNADGTNEEPVTPNSYDVQDPHWAVKKT